MKKESSKEAYLTPEAKVFILLIEAAIAQSNTETIDDDPEEHGWTNP